MTNPNVQGGNYDRYKEWHFTVPGLPVPKGRPRVVHKDRSGQMLEKPRTFTPKATKDYEKRVAQYALTVGVRRIPAPRHVFLGIVVYLPEKSVTDLDNVYKAVADGLEGVAYDNDNQVWAGSFRREADNANPRVEVTIREEE